MGLDMYLKAERYGHNYDFNGGDVEKNKLHSKLLEASGLTGDDVAEGCCNVMFTVAYWRKCNAIHGWFVRKVQDGKDECDPYEVSREQLEKLMNDCKEVRDFPTKASELLPPQSGFFFGGTDIDDDYFRYEIDSTIGKLEKILNNPKFAKDWRFEYQSSW